MAYNEKRKQNTLRYIEENLEEIRFRVRKGEKSKLEAAADAAGYSAYSRFCIDAINEKAKDQILTMPRERSEKRKAEPAKGKIVKLQVLQPIEPLRLTEHEVARFISDMRKHLSEHTEIALKYIDETTKQCSMKPDSLVSYQLLAFFAGAQFALSNLAVDPDELEKRPKV